MKRAPFGSAFVGQQPSTIPSNYTFSYSVDEDRGETCRSIMSPRPPDQEESRYLKHYMDIV